MSALPSQPKVYVPKERLEERHDLLLTAVNLCLCDVSDAIACENDAVRTSTLFHADNNRSSPAANERDTHERALSRPVYSCLNAAV